MSSLRRSRDAPDPVLLTIRAARRLAEDFHLLDLDWPAGMAEPLPGQFVMVRTREGTDPLWRRPLGVHDVRRVRGAVVLSLLFQVVGPTTRELSGLAPGATLDLLGPHGRGFKLDAAEQWLVSGGRGVAPLFYVARILHRTGRALPRVPRGPHRRAHPARARPGAPRLPRRGRDRRRQPRPPRPGHRSARSRAGAALRAPARGRHAAGLRAARHAQGRGGHRRRARGRGAGFGRPAHGLRPRTLSRLHRSGARRLPAGLPARAGLRRSRPGLGARHDPRSQGQDRRPRAAEPGHARLRHLRVRPGDDPPRRHRRSRRRGRQGALAAALAGEPAAAHRRDPLRDAQLHRAGEHRAGRVPRRQAAEAPAARGQGDRQLLRRLPGRLPRARRPPRRRRGHPRAGDEHLLPERRSAAAC